MPPPWPSASASASGTATRFATYWIVDALAGDDSVDLSVIQALLQASSAPLASAPEATRLRVTLRSLQEVSSAGGDADAAGVLRDHGAPSCRDILGEVESSGILEKDSLPPFSQNIQETMRTKKLTLPETSLQLLKGVDPWIASMTPQSQLEHNGAEQCDNGQSLRSSHECVNIEKPVSPTDSAEVQQDTMANLVNERETGNLQKDPSAATSVLHQSCTPESRSYVPPQEDTIDADGLGARSPERSSIVEGNMSVGSVLASAGCDAPLQGSITEPFSQQDKHDPTATVEPKSCRQESPKLPHCADGEGADDGGSNNQSCKVSSHEGPSAHATVSPGFDRISDVIPTDASEPGHLPECITAQDTTMILQPDSRKAHLSALEHERGEKVNQDLEDVSASIRPVEKDHVHGDQTLQSTTVLLSISCNGANQGSKSETNLQPGTATKDRMAFEEQNAEKTHLEVSGANKVNQALHDDGSIMKNNMVHGGPSAETAPLSQNCNVSLHDKTSETNCFSDQKNGKNRSDVQKDNCHTSIPSSSKHRDGESAKKTSNEEKSSKDQDIADTVKRLLRLDWCMKCGKGGQLLKCSGCILVAHDSCFGSSATFEETNLFYCPICRFGKAQEACLKAIETYFKAKDNRDAFLGTTQAVKQHDEQLTGAQPGASKRDGHLNRSDMSKRNSIHQNEAYDLAHRDEEPHQQRKKQKINARSKQVLTEKVPFQNSGPASKNKHSVRQSNSKTRVKDPEKKQQAGDKEAGNGRSSPEMKASAQRRCDRPLNQDGEADQEDSLRAPNQSGGSDELEATSVNDSGKQSSPPSRSMRHNKKRLQENEPAVPSKSRKGIAKQDQHMPTLLRKRKYVQPQKRYSNPVGPFGRRKKLAWTPEEETCLKEAMEFFTPQSGAQISWIQILGYGSDVFHKTREPSDLRVKWRSMMMKETDDAGNQEED